ncbi:hypothetical protein NL676_017776 [Syzygium grande]|nr:hypothetical protein NL676_017776 [Syzygium grande]
MASGVISKLNSITLALEACFFEESPAHQTQPRLDRSGFWTDPCPIENGTGSASSSDLQLGAQFGFSSVVPSSSKAICNSLKDFAFIGKLRSSPIPAMAERHHQVAIGVTVRWKWMHPFWIQQGRMVRILQESLYRTPGHLCMRLDDVRREKAAEEEDQKEAACAIQQIEALSVSWEVCYTRKGI